MDYKMHTCPLSQGLINGEDDIVIYIARDRTYGIPIHDGGSSYIRIHFCPWCGEKFPPSLRDTRLDRLEALGFEPFEDDIPEEYKTDEWWRSDPTLSP